MIRRFSRPSSGRRWSARAGVLAVLILGAAVGSAANELSEARVRIVMADAVTCDVTATFAVALDRDGDIEHRLQRLEGSHVDLLEITGAEQAAPARSIGLTESVTVRFPNAGSYRYELRYRVRQADDWAYRCPVWLPVVAAHRPRAVEIEVTLPPDAQPASGSFPALLWSGGTGRATLGHLPAFMRIPYAAPGEPRSPTRDLGRTMDFAAIGILVAGTAVWVVRRRR